MREQKNVLVVQFLGASSVSWNGVRLLGDPKTCDTQFARLLQILLHCREEGVDRVQLQEELFYDHEVQDLAHSISVLLYNTRKRLRDAGLPAGEYIEKRNGRYFWTAEIPVLEDAGEFERLYHTAKTLSNGEEKRACLLRACDIYAGEFLPAQTGSLWAAREARRYRELFRDCVRETAALLRRAKDYDRLEALGRQAARVQPYSDWEQIALEALITQGRAEEAEKLYWETEQEYFRELKVRPDRHMLELRSQIDELKHPSQKILEIIQEQLSEKKAQRESAYFCSYSVFESIYHLAARFAEHSGQPSCLLLCILEAPEATRKSLDLDFRKALCGALRQTDAACHYGHAQYLVLLNDTTPSEGEEIRTQIDAALPVPARSYVRYYISPV